MVVYIHEYVIGMYIYCNLYAFIFNYIDTSGRPNRNSVKAFICYYLCVCVCHYPLFMVGQQ